MGSRIWKPRGGWRPVWRPEGASSDDDLAALLHDAMAGRDTYADAPVERHNVYGRSLHIAAIVAMYRLLL